MGTVIISISYFLQTGTVTAYVLLISGPTSVLIGAILMANNIRDLDDDQRHGRRTLAILLGRRGAINCLSAMLAAAYLWIVLLVAAGSLPLWGLAVFASIPKAAAAVRGFRQASTPQSLMPAMVATAQTNTLFGFCLTIGLLTAYWLSI